MFFYLFKFSMIFADLLMQLLPIQTMTTFFADSGVDADAVRIHSESPVAFDVGSVGDGDGDGGGNRMRREPTPRRRSVGEDADFRQPGSPQRDAKTLARHVIMVTMFNVV